MLSKLIAPSEGLLTFFTLVRFLTSMDFLMLTKLIAATKGFPAILTFKRILLMMSPMGSGRGAFSSSGPFYTIDDHSIDIPASRALWSFRRTFIYPVMAKGFTSSI